MCIKFENNFNKIFVLLIFFFFFQKNYNRVIGKADGAVTAVQKQVNVIFRSILAVLSIAGVVLAWTSTVNNVPELVCAMKSVFTVVLITGFWSVGTKAIAATTENYRNKLQTVKPRRACNTITQGPSEQTHVFKIINT